MSKTFFFSAVAILCCTAAVAEELPQAAKLPPGQKWVFTFTNFANNARTDVIIQRLKQAKQLGYNGILISDTKFEKFQLNAPECYANIKRFRDICTEEKMFLGVAVAPIGYANNLLTLDPNLCEGMPVRNSLFVVKEGQLRPFHEPIAIKGAALDEFTDNTPVGWEVDAPSSISFQDQKVVYAGESSLRQQEPGKAPHGVARLWQTLKVKPYSYYHISIMVKTENWTGKDMRIYAMGKEKRSLNWLAPNIKKTMDWSRIDGAFSSMDNDEVTIYIGSYGTKKAEGTIWYDDFKMEPAGFVNVLRRDSLPLQIMSLDGNTTYQEGKDFVPVADPKLFNDPNPGYFTVWHDEPIVAIPKESRLREGDKIRASFHFGYGAGKSNNFNMCMAEPKTCEVLDKHIAWVKDNVKPDLYWLYHDEIRVGGWDDSCVRSGKSLGQLLADNVRQCIQMVKRHDPGKPIIVWNDMFDPHHNAGRTGNYYLTKGEKPWWGAWEGLSSDVGVLNWKENSADSLNFFASRGQQQLLAGFYDKDVGMIDEWLTTAKPIENVVGVVYMSWVDDFSRIEKFMERLKAWEASQAKSAK